MRVFVKMTSFVALGLVCFLRPSFSSLAFEITDYVIAVEVNEGYINMFNNWLNHLDKLSGKLRKYVHASAHDEASCSHMLKIGIRHECAIIKSLSQPALTYNTKAFNQLTCERPKHILRLLQEGKTVLYTDIDTVWLRDVLKFAYNQNSSLVLQHDCPETEVPCINVCTCLIAIRPHRDTRRLVNNWIRQCGTSKDKQDQEVFRKLVLHPKFKKISKTVFPPTLFLSGVNFFGAHVVNYTPRRSKKEMLSQAYWIHNNWIKGERRKVERFKSLKLWNETLPSHPFNTADS